MQQFEQQFEQPIRDGWAGQKVMQFLRERPVRGGAFSVDTIHHCWLRNASRTLSARRLILTPWLEILTPLVGYRCFGCVSENRSVRVLGFLRRIRHAVHEFLAETRRRLWIA